LSRSAEFDRVYRHGRSVANRYLVLYAFPRDRPAPSRDELDERGDEAGARLGVSVGRRVGSAVARNRVKRLLRDAFWSLPGVPADHDYVVVARPDVAALVERAGLDAITKELRELFEKLAPGEGGTTDAVAS
jgi:ribonuclease P protein component